MKEINVLEILGKNMHDIRFKKNISIQDLAKKVKIDVEALMKFEAGEPSGLNIEQYAAIAASLGANLDMITNGIHFDD